MVRKKQLRIQIGKKGLTKEFLEDLKRRFEDAENIKIDVLKSARENKEDVKKYAEEIHEFLGAKFTYRVLGFNISFKKWRRAKS